MKINPFDQQYQCGARDDVKCSVSQCSNTPDHSAGIFLKIIGTGNTDPIWICGWCWTAITHYAGERTTTSFYMEHSQVYKNMIAAHAYAALTT